MKRSSYYLFLFLMVSASCTWGAKTASAFSSDSPSIRKVTLDQMFRYGREMYRSANYPAAIRTFKSMLDISCQDRLAQYHLLKISEVPGHHDLKLYLHELPCGEYDFSETDFLPASFYRSSDADLLREQIAQYNKKYRLAKRALENTVSHYDQLTKELENDLKALQTAEKSQVNSLRNNVQTLTQALNSKETLALELSSLISNAKDDLIKERLAHRRNIEHIQDQLEALGIELDPRTNTVVKTANDAYARTQAQSPMTIPVEAQQKAINIREDLEHKKMLLEDKDHELATIQAKFEDIQRRLNDIQKTIQDKNAEIRSLKGTLQ